MVTMIELARSGGSFNHHHGIRNGTFRMHCWNGVTHYTYCVGGVPDVPSGLPLYGAEQPANRRLTRLLFAVLRPCHLAQCLQLAHLTDYRHSGKPCTAFMMRSYLTSWFGGVRLISWQYSGYLSFTAS
jgi:hypothetical protein